MRRAASPCLWSAGEASSSSPWALHAAGRGNIVRFRRFPEVSRRVLCAPEPHQAPLPARPVPRQLLSLPRDTETVGLKSSAPSAEGSPWAIPPEPKRIKGHARNIPEAFFCDSTDAPWRFICLLGVALCLTSQNHRIVGVGRDLCGSSSPTLLPKQGHPQQAAQDLVQAGREYLQRRRLHNLPGQPVPVLSIRLAVLGEIFLCFPSDMIRFVETRGKQRGGAVLNHQDFPAQRFSLPFARKRCVPELSPCPGVGIASPPTPRSCDAVTCPN